MRLRGETLRKAWLGILAAVVTGAGGAGGWAQGAPEPGTQSGADQGVRILREIRDLHTGVRWLLLANTQNPAAPGRIVLEGAEGAEARVVVIHRGDRVAVEEHTASADGFLEGTAAEPASAGSCFAVRLKAGGKIVRALAMAPGKARLVAAMGEAGKGRP